MNIDQLQPGPDLDRLVTERVMGWRLVVGWWRLDDGKAPVDQTDWRPSVDWGAAGVVIDRMPELGYHLHFSHGWITTYAQDAGLKPVKSGGYSAHVFYAGNGKSTGAFADGETAPLAICRAALKAVGVDKAG